MKATRRVDVAVLNFGVVIMFLASVLASFGICMLVLDDGVNDESRLWRIC